jgi:osmoprotectant transport system permease protein
VTQAEADVAGQVMRKLCAWLERLGCGVVLMFVLAQVAFAQPLVIGSKRFTESYILGEVVSQAASAAGHDRVVLKSGLGNTGILLSALRSGEIDLYPEYTGTITREVLKTEQVLSLAEINARLLPIGLQAGVLFGFDNSYVLAVRRDLAEKLQLRNISDLAKHPKLVLGLSHEFIGRSDGWKGLATRYQLEKLAPKGLDHGLAYEAIRARQIDVMDAYGTDSKLLRDELVVLRDDLNFFPTYDALLLYRSDVPAKFASTWKVLSALQNTISQQAMGELNARAEVDGQPFSLVARDFLQRQGSGQVQDQVQGKTGATGVEGSVPHAGRASTQQSFIQTLFGPDFWRLSAQHLFLVLVSLLLAIAVGIPLGVLSFYWPGAGQVVLSVTSVIQTIPSLALLAFLISLFGLIGTIPAIVALFLYALLPIIQSTHAGLSEISPSMRQAATALGLGARDQLWLIELPLARTMILSGIKVSAVLSVGTATIAAFVGAGGFGERIAQGLALNNTSMLLAGAIPSAALALLMQFGFFVFERRLSRHKN